MAETFCTRCGTPGSSAFCADCGQPRDPALIPAAHPGSATPVVTENVRHALPALLSFFVPTLGQLIKGDVLTALAILGIFCGIMLVAFAGLAIFAPFAAFILWVWQIYDAYSAPDGETKRELKRLGRR